MKIDVLFGVQNLTLGLDLRDGVLKFSHPSGLPDVNSGKANFGGMWVTLGTPRDPHMRLYAPPNHVLAEKVSLNPVLSDTVIGKFVNPIFKDAAQAKGLIKVQLFVALVVMALGTSIFSGPMMKWLLSGDEEDEAVGVLLRNGAWVPDLRAQTAAEAIEELTNALGEQLGGKKAATLRAVLEREATASTGLGDQVAVPHASIEGLQKPLLALGVSRLGVDFNSVDGRPANCRGRNRPSSASGALRPAARRRARTASRA